MSEVDVWNDVEKRFEVLNQHLRRRFAALNKDAVAERDALEKSVRGLVTIVEELLASTDNVLHDRRLRDDVVALLAALRQALTANVERISRGIGQPGRADTTAAMHAGRPTGDGSHIQATTVRKRAATTRTHPATNSTRRAAPRSRHGG